MDKPRISEPILKTEDQYLTPSEWYGEPVPQGKIGPYGMGGTCWYVTVPSRGARPHVFAAETPELARAAARGFIGGVEWAKLGYEWAERQGEPARNADDA